MRDESNVSGTSHSDRGSLEEPGGYPQASGRLSRGGRECLQSPLAARRSAKGLPPKRQGPVGVEGRLASASLRQAVREDPKWQLQRLPEGPGAKSISRLGLEDPGAPGTTRRPTPSLSCFV